MNGHSGSMLVFLLTLGAFTAFADTSSYPLRTNAQAGPVAREVSINSSDAAAIRSRLMIDKASQNALTFTLTNTSGASWAAPARVPAGNSKGNVLESHVPVCSMGGANQDPRCNPKNDASVDGSATNEVVPEPKLLMALAIGMSGLAFFQARKRKGISNN